MMALQYLPWSSSAHACETAGGLDPYAASGYGAHGSLPVPLAPPPPPLPPPPPPAAATTSGADIACAQLRVTRPATARKGRAWSGDSQGQRKG